MMAEPTPRKQAPRKKAPRPTDKHVGSRIRMRRQMLHLSRESLADAIGITFQQIQKYENGTNRVSASRLQEIAEALGCQPAWFFEGSSAEAANKGAAARRIDADLSAFFADRYAANLIRGFVRLAPPVKRAIVKVVTAAAAEPEGV